MWLTNANANVQHEVTGVKKINITQAQQTLRLSRVGDGGGGQEEGAQAAQHRQGEGEGRKEKVLDRQCQKDSQEGSGE